MAVSEDEVVRLRRELAALRQSTSWRVTAPLRRLAAGLRGEAPAAPVEMAVRAPEPAPLQDRPGSARGLDAVRWDALRRINIGCGRDKRQGYLNVDSDAACAPDLLLEDNEFTGFPRRHFRDVLAKDVLEHIPRASTLSALLEWADLMEADGRLELQTSSILGVADSLRASPRYADQHGWTICLFGNQAHPGDFHFTGFTETTLRVQLLAAGFEIRRLEVHDGWLFWLEAFKTWDWTAPLSSALDDEGFVRAAYDHAFGRDPAEMLAPLAGDLRSSVRTRRGLLKHLMSSPERLFVTAARHGL